MANPVVNILIRAQDKASKSFNSLGNNAKKVAGLIAGYFSFQFFKSAVEDAAAFEKQMDTVAAVSGATGDALLSLTEIAKEMGATTQFTAIEAAQALESLGRAGLSAAQQAEALPSVLQLAQANGIELGQAASFITKAVAGMGLEFSDAARVADVLTKAAASANTSVEGLGVGLAYAAPVAQSLGLTLEQTVAIMAQLANAGIDASRAGTSLNTMMIQFSDPASKFNKELSNLGINTTDFNVALVELAAKGDAGKTAILALGSEAGPALTALLNQGVPALTALTGQLEGSAGAAEKAAAIMSGNFDGAIKTLGSSWDSLRLKLATPVLEPLTNIINEVSAKFKEFGASGGLDEFANNIVLTLNTVYITLKTTSAGVRLIFNSLQAAVEVLAIAFLDSFALLNKAIASVTFGDVSQRAADMSAELSAVSDALKIGLAEDISDIGSAYSDLTTSFDITSTSSANAAEKIITANAGVVDSENEKAGTAKEVSKSIIDGNKKAADSAALLLSASGALKIDLDEIRGIATKTGIDSSKAFSDIAASAGLTKDQISLLALKTLEFAKTKGDIDLLKQSFEKVGVEVEKHPILLQNIIDKYVQMGGSLDDIPKKWRDITGAAKESMGTQISLIDQLEARDNAWHANARQNIANQEAAYIASVNRKAEADRAAWEEKESRRTASTFSPHSDDTKAALSGLSQEEQQRILTEAANIANSPTGGGMAFDIQSYIKANAGAAQARSVNVNFKANNTTATANFGDQNEADNFMNILKTAGSVS
jgi:TP901 family phage tail tape measure protein